MKRRTIYEICEYKDKKTAVPFALCDTKEAVLQFLERGRKGSVKAEFRDDITLNDIDNGLVVRKTYPEDGIGSLIGVKQETEYYIIFRRDLISQE